jgi:hypothetical protein
MHPVPTRWNDRQGMTVSDAVSQRIAVVSAVADNRGNRPAHLPEEGKR